MEYRTLDLTLISAEGLKKPTFFRNNHVYAVASISGNLQKLRTPTNRNGGSNPSWNFPMKFTINEAAGLENRQTLVVKIKAVGMFHDKNLGQVHVPIKELLDGVKPQGKALQIVSYRVSRASGKLKGVLNFSYKFGEKFSGKAVEPVTAYPPGMVVGSSSGYQPPYAAVGGHYPPQPPPQGYGSYPQQPPPPGYGGYPPQTGPGHAAFLPRRTNNAGMGIGTGLLGGLLLGDLMSHAAHGGGCGGGGCGGGGCGGGCGGGGCGGF